MQLRRIALFAMGIALIGGLTTVASATAEAKKTGSDIWRDEPRETRPYWQRDLSKDEVERVLEGIRKRDPAKAKALTELREKNADQFLTELREQGRPEIDQIARERWEARRQERNNRFLEWLKANYPFEEQALLKLKEKDPQLYLKGFENMMNRYGYIFEAENSSPELATVLKEDLELKKRSEQLCARYRNEKVEAKKQALGAEIEGLVARRYDLIARRKEIAYEQLLKRVEDLQKQVTNSKADIAQFKTEQVKRENVKQRVETLIGNKARFKWD